MKLRLLLVALCLVLVEVRSFAQVRSEDPRTTARMHIGPFYLRPVIELQELGVDTNVFNETDNPAKDFTFTVVPRLETSVPFAQRGLLKLSSGAGLVYYHKHGSERSLNPDVGLRGELYLNRLTLYAEPTYGRTRERPNFEIDLRSRRVEEGTSTGMELRILPKLTVEISGGHLRTAYDADQFFLGTSLSESLNRDSLSVGTSIRWAKTALTTFVISGDARSDRFLVSPIRDSDSTSFSLGVALKPRALISGTAQLGWKRFVTLDTAVPDFSGIVAAAGIGFSVLGSTSFGFTVNRDTNYSFQPQEPYYVADSYGLTIEQHLGGRFDASGGLERHRYSYRLVAQIDVRDAATRRGRTDITDSFSASIGYRVGESGRFGIGISYWIRNSDAVTDRDYGALRIRTTFTYGL